MITHLIFSFDDFIPDVDAFDPVVGVISTVARFDKDWLGICYATATQSREIVSDCVLTGMHALYLDMAAHIDPTVSKPTDCHILTFFSAWKSKKIQPLLFQWQTGNQLD